jgi:2-amino-4-hydroxy-6-hydroxymethyldihydropteridine diphosphokinase
MYDNLACRDEVLTLPHPRMSQRAFVLKPLMEIAPDCTIPDHGHIAELLTACNEQKLEQIKA